MLTLDRRPSATFAPVWRTPEGLALTGPAHFRFDAPYRAMEEIVGTKPA